MTCFVNLFRSRSKAFSETLQTMTEHFDIYVGHIGHVPFEWDGFLGSCQQRSVLGALSRGFDWNLSAVSVCFCRLVPPPVVPCYKLGCSLWWSEQNFLIFFLQCLLFFFSSPLALPECKKVMLLVTVWLNCAKMHSDCIFFQSFFFLFAQFSLPLFFFLQSVHKGAFISLYAALPFNHVAD